MTRLPELKNPWSKTLIGRKITLYFWRFSGTESPSDRVSFLKYSVEMKLSLINVVSDKLNQTSLFSNYKAKYCYETKILQYLWKSVNEFAYCSHLLSCRLIGLTVRKRSSRVFGPLFSIQKRRGVSFSFIHWSENLTCEKKIHTRALGINGGIVRWWFYIGESVPLRPTRLPAAVCLTFVFTRFTDTCLFLFLWICVNQFCGISMDFYIFSLLSQNDIYYPSISYWTSVKNFYRSTRYLKI